MSIKKPIYITYMLQQVEYNPYKLWQWHKDLGKFLRPISKVSNRKSLVLTNRARLLVLAGYMHYAFIFAIGIFAIGAGMPLKNFVFAVVISYLIASGTSVVYYWILASLVLKFIIKPERNKQRQIAKDIFAKHRAIKIAVLGSYGKTSMKEMLALILSESKNVAMTLGNLNVVASHAKFAKSLTGTEEIIIVEFGEGKPGDISDMAEMLKPDYAIITGLAPNHLDEYDSIEMIAGDFLEIQKFVSPENIFFNTDSEHLKKYIPPKTQTYSSSTVLGWTIANVDVKINKLSFVMNKSGISIKVESRLTGRHHVAPLALAVALAYKLGLKANAIELGISKITPHKHRMEPRQLSGAWIIDDTYNGNIEGMSAGLKLLSELKAKRKWYVTPGLVDQGEETNNVHIELGKKIAESNPDIVVLMENTVRPVIQKSMRDNGFKGELRIEAEPLEFYKNLEYIIANGDIVMMQNDWTDNYS
ncbi:hypothetical protein KC960_02820 [Candidatus Saccharibacteria bacterium]|nr:hypothetical protein [Candidatus Saccharibacteria bacterium]